MRGGSISESVTRQSRDRQHELFVRYTLQALGGVAPCSRQRACVCAVRCDMC